MTLASIDWFRAAADILGAFACTLVGQWWGYRQGLKAGRRERVTCARDRVAADRVAAVEAEAASRASAESIHTPDRDDERLGL